MNELPVALLRLLADGEFHSGEALARTLEVSRATVWNAVRALEAADLEVHKVPGRGYRLPESISMLDAREVERAAGGLSTRLRVEVVDTVESTNTLMMARAATGAASGSVIAAESQLRGRGRMGRPWHAGLGRSLTFSLLWRFTRGAAELGGLSLATGLAIVRALETLGASELALKWPNDVLWRERKLAGVLIEMHGDALGPSAIVVGIGLNVRLSGSLRGRIDQPAAELEAVCGRRLDRNVVLGALLMHLATVFGQFDEHGFAPLRSEWERRHAFQDREIAVNLPNGHVEHGIARGVADNGALLFERDGAVRLIHSGEISVRPGGTEQLTSERLRSGA